MIQLKEKIIIAIDGYSSCGKSSYAKLIAAELAYIYIDSGAMYRAVTLFALNRDLIKDGKANIDKLITCLPEIKISFNRDKTGSHTLLNNENVEDDIRTIKVSSVVSEVSKIPEVRERLVQIQRDMGLNKGVVMDGRDIGTVVFPDAELKIFMTAENGIRAKRRYDELLTKGMKVNLEEVLENISQRDFIDSNREHSPLSKAKDAVILDNSYMTFKDQMIWFRELLRKRNLLK